MNYKAILLQQTKEFVEQDSIDFSFIIMDENNDVLSNTDLADFKFNAEITDDGYELLKEDANYDAGAATEISVSEKTVTVHVVEDETDEFDGIFRLQLIMTNKTTSNKYSVYNGKITFLDTATD